MKQAFLAVLVFALLLLTITSPFAGLAALMLILISIAFLRTLWTIIDAGIKTPSKKS
ncbi:MAG TPA: hypothetical protein V6D13_16825 [Halomicronema sp.]